MTKLKTGSEKVTSSRAKRFRLNELEALAQGKGAELVYNRQNGFFILKKTGTTAWVWIIDSETQEIIKALRALNREQWIDVMNANIDRLNEEASKI